MPAFRAFTPAALGLTVGAALAGIGVLYGPSVIAVVGGILLGLVLPGAAAAHALFPGRIFVTFERLVLVPALSFAVLVLGGLGAYAIGVRLTRTSWVALTFASTLVLVAVGHLRRARQARRNWAAAETAYLGAIPIAEPSPRISTIQAVLRLAPLLLAVVLAGGAGYISQRSAAQAQHSQAGFTALSLVPAGPGKAEGPTRPVVIGLASHEQTTMRYDVRVSGPNGFAATFTPTVRSGATWANTLDVPADRTVTVQLFRVGDTKPYRTVWIAGKVR